MICFMSYEDIIAHIDESLSDGNKLSGVVINAGANELLLDRDSIAYAEEARKAPAEFLQRQLKALYDE